MIGGGAEVRFFVNQKLYDAMECYIIINVISFTLFTRQNYVYIYTINLYRWDHTNTNPLDSIRTLY